MIQVTKPVKGYWWVVAKIERRERCSECEDRNIGMCHYFPNRNIASKTVPCVNIRYCPLGVTLR